MKTSLLFHVVCDKCHIIYNTETLGIVEDTQEYAKALKEAHSVLNKLIAFERKRKS